MKILRYKITNLNPHKEIKKKWWKRDEWLLMKMNKKIVKMTIIVKRCEWLLWRTSFSHDNMIAYKWSTIKDQAPKVRNSCTLKHLPIHSRTSQSTLQYSLGDDEKKGCHLVKNFLELVVKG